MIRNEFEKLFPVPEGIEWDGGGYRFKYSCNENEWAAREYESLWQGFQAGHAAGLEDGAAICDNADKSTHPADLADAIRAMKEQKK